ncbi:MAG TPA: aconitate hydratase AcnA [Thermoplasmata archaeon]|nr:aconitate hydratase AcnA [Thermoplasmata archaeon]
MNPTGPSDPLGVRTDLSTAHESFHLFQLSKLAGVDAERLRRRPLTVQILLENLVRNAGAQDVDAATLRALANGAAIPAEVELPFRPVRVLLQDFTGVPILVDLAAMRNAAAERGLEASRVNPSVPVDLIIDHSVQVDSFRRANSMLVNLEREFDRNEERYAFLKWAPNAFRGLSVVPPGNGICHQVNLEYLSQVVALGGGDGGRVAYPDTLVGSDSHTTMVNGLGILAWGVGGIEAESVMLGEPTYFPPINVVGVRLTGKLPEGSTATDVVLELTRALRAKGVVDRFVEFFGPGVGAMSVPDRATISNMCPEYGATAALFPIDDATTTYLRGTGRSESVIERVQAYARAQGWWRQTGDPDPEFDELLEFDLGSVVPTVSGPRNPEESMPLAEVPKAFRRAADAYRKDHPRPAAPDPGDGVRDGAVVIAAITSCTNTSNPDVMLGAGLLARHALERGLSVPSYVKTSLAPGSKVVTSYLERAHLLEPLNDLGFSVVGFGCTTCIGNSGPLPPDVAKSVEANDLVVAAVLSGNRNFEARIHSQVRANYLASPLLVVAYALAGRVDIDLSHDPIGTDRAGQPVYLREIWPKAEEVRGAVEGSLDPELYRAKYRTILEGDPHWNRLPENREHQYSWDPHSTYLRLPPYFELPPPTAPSGSMFVDGARILAVFGDRVSTDHISPAGEISADSPAGRYLEANGVAPSDFNTYGARRGNHEVMVRGTFANIRIKNRMAGGREGGYTVHQPSGEPLTIYDASLRYQQEGVPLVVFAGKSYGQGSSRDWAAKGPRLLGVRAVIAESYERIHRSNLVGMGVLPLQFDPGTTCAGLGLTGAETIRISLTPGQSFGPRVRMVGVATREGAVPIEFPLRSRIDSPIELEYYTSGGLLPYVLHRIAG